MQELERPGESSRRFVAALGCELRCFSKSDRWQEQKREPGPTAHVAGVFTKEQPAETGDDEHDNRSDAPAAKNSARPPRSRQDKQGRSNRNKQKDVI